MWIIIWKNVYDSWSPWPGPRGCFGALSAISIVERTRHFLLHGHMTSVPLPAAQSSGLFYESWGAWASHEETMAFC